jgi:hypothetical protein
MRNKNNQYKIYVLKDPDTKEIRYVGATCQPLYQRLSNHIYYAKKRNCTHVHNWIFSLLQINKKPTIETIEVVTENTWEEREKYWISFYKIEFDLTNLHEGGKGLVKIRNLSSRERSAMGHYIPIVQLNSAGMFINEFSSIREAEIKTGISNTNIGNVLGGRNKTAGGYQWLYKSNYDSKNIYTLNKKNSDIGYAKQILRKNIETNEEITYNTISEACNHNNLEYSMLNKIIKTGRSICNFVFSWKKVEDIV